MKRLLVLLCISFSAVAHAQNWEWAREARGTFGEGFYCCTDTFGNVYGAGAGEGAHVLKYNSSGSLLWSIEATGVGDISAVGFANDLFGNEYLLGSYMTTVTFGGHTLTAPGPSNFYYFISKINADGIVEWLKPIGNAYSFVIAGSTSWIKTDSRGLIYICCSFSGNPTIGSISLTNTNTDNSTDILVAKFDSSGSAIWAKSFGGRSWEWPYGISVTSSGNIYIDGYFDADTLTFGSIALIDTGIYTGGFLAKLDSNGNTSWAHNLPRSQLSGVTSNETEDAFITGNYTREILTLGTCVLPYPPTSNGYGFLAKYDSSGNVSWAKLLQGNYVIPWAPAIDPCGNVWIISNMGNSSFAIAADTIDGHVLLPLPNNGLPNFIAAWANSGAYITAIAMQSGSTDDPNGITVDRCGNVYVIADQEDCDTMIIGIDTFSLSGEWEFIAKYNPNLGCGSCLGGIAGLSLVVSPSDTLCAGALSTFNVSPTTYCASASYQWFLNGSIVGTTSHTYSYIPHNGDSIYCKVHCFSGDTGISNKIRMTVIPIDTPTINITASPSDTVCAGVVVTYHTTISGGGSIPVYKWYLN